MMLYPSIDKLLKKIDSKYSLVILSSKRAHELHHHEPPMLEHYESHKNVGRALEEVVAGDLTIREDSETRTRIIKFIVKGNSLGFFCFRSFEV